MHPLFCKIAHSHTWNQRRPTHIRGTSTDPLTYVEPMVDPFPYVEPVADPLTYMERAADPLTYVEPVAYPFTYLEPSSKTPSFMDMVAAEEDSLLSAVSLNPFHVLHPFPPILCHHPGLHKRSHQSQLPPKDDKNNISQVLYRSLR